MTGISPVDSERLRVVGPTVPDEGARADAVRVHWWLLALIPFLALAFHHWAWQPGAESGDYAQYLSHARAIVEGRPYGDIGYIFHPAAWSIGPRVYPPGLPMVLAPLVAIDGTDSVLIRLLSLTSVGIFAWCAFRRLAREVEPWQAAIGAGFAAFTIEAALGTIAPISDTGFCALIWAMILLADTTERWTLMRLVGITALGFAAIAFRVAGIALIPAFGIWALLSWRRLGPRGVIPAVLWSGAGLVALATDVAPVPSGGLLPRISGIPSRIRQLWEWYSSALPQSQLYPFRVDAWNDGYHLIASMLAVIGCLVLLWRGRRSVMVAFTIAYAALLALAPVAELRYAWPLFPILASAVAVGAFEVLAFLGRRVPSADHRRWRRVSAAVVAAALALVASGALRIEWMRAAPRALATDPEARATFQWLRERNAREPIRVAYANPRVVSLATRVSAMGIVQRNAPGVMLSFVEKGITHFIWQRNDESGCLQRIANTLPLLHPTRFSLEFGNADFQIYRLQSVSEPLDQKYERVNWSNREAWCPDWR